MASGAQAVTFTVGNIDDVGSNITFTDKASGKTLFGLKGQTDVLTFTSPQTLMVSGNALTGSISSLSIAPTLPDTGFTSLQLNIRDAVTVSGLDVTFLGTTQGGGTFGFGADLDGGDNENNRFTFHQTLGGPLITSLAGC